MATGKKVIPPLPAGLPFLVRQLKILIRNKVKTSVKKGYYMLISSLTLKLVGKKVDLYSQKFKFKQTEQLNMRLRNEVETTVMEDLLILTVQSTMEIGIWVKGTVQVSKHMWMDHITMEIGYKVKDTVQESKPMLMDQCTKENLAGL